MKGNRMRKVRRVIFCLAAGLVLSGCGKEVSKEKLVVLEDTETEKVQEEAADETTMKPEKQIILKEYPVDEAGKKIVEKVYYREDACQFYLLDTQTGEQEYLFDAYNVITVMLDGVYYSVDGAYDISYYSFEKKESRNLFTLREESAQQLSVKNCDGEWIYLEGPCLKGKILKVSGEQGICEETE